MKVVFTDDALRDLDEIFQYISANYPAVYRQFENRLKAVATRIGAWPESAQEVAQRPGVRSVPFIRYPYRLF
jgi:toxin ParE1/3/4